MRDCENVRWSLLAVRRGRSDVCAAVMTSAMFATIALPGWCGQASAEPIAFPSRTLTDCEQTDSAPRVVRACTALLNGQGDAAHGLC